MHVPAPSPRLLLIQNRAEKLVAMHERQCVLERSGLDLTALDSVNVTAVEGIPRERYDAADGVVIGASVGSSALDDEPFTSWLLEDVRRLVEGGVPLLGCCWGAQVIARALGGELARDPGPIEFGIRELEPTPAAQDSPVFDHLVDPFPVLAGHRDRIASLPPGAVAVATGDDGTEQAFTLPGQAVHGTLFHVEMTPTQLLERLGNARQFMPDDREFEALESRLRPTPEAARILPRFVTSLRG